MDHFECAAVLHNLLLGYNNDIPAEWLKEIDNGHFWMNNYDSGHDINADSNKN